MHRARVAVTAIFAIHGLLFASFTAHIPTVQEAVGLSNGQLGTALLGAPLGSVLAMMLVGKLIPRFGSRAVTRGGLVGYGLAGSSSDSPTASRRSSPPCSSGVRSRAPLTWR